jgi:methylenetetrahydrofolate reductase (NADPH)
MANDGIKIETVMVDAPTGTSGARITSLLRAASLEVTQPAPEEIEQIATALPRGTEIFISDIPRRSAADAVRACTLIAAAGLVPVPHIAVRRMETAAALERLLAHCAELAGVRKVMLIAGDRKAPAGPFGDVAAALEDGVAQRCGIVEVSLAGYPEGHPRISAVALAQSLERKHELLAAQGIKERLVTQFGFDPDAPVRFVGQLRQAGFRAPVLIGLAGPASARTLMQFAMRCGVQTASRFLVRDGKRIASGLAGHSLERLLTHLSDFAADEESGDVRPHFFSFGGGVQTARWIRSIQHGQLRSFGDAAGAA